VNSKLMHPRNQEGVAMSFRIQNPSPLRITRYASCNILSILLNGSAAPHSNWSPQVKAVR